MKIAKAHLRDYKSIIDTSITFQSDITCLVGITGAGKTSILELLSKIDEHKSFRENDLCDEKGGRLSEFRGGKLKADQFLQFEITFDTEAMDQEQLSHIFKDDIPASITLKRYFDGTIEFDTQMPINDTVKKMRRTKNQIQLTIKKMIQLIRSLEDNGENEKMLEYLKTFLELVDTHFDEIKSHFESFKSSIYNSLKELEDDSLKNAMDLYNSKIESGIMHINELRAHLPVRLLYDIIPKPEYVSDLPDPEDDILLDDYLADMDSNDTFQSIGIICGLNTIELNKIRNEVNERQKNFFKPKSEKLTRIFRDFWNQTEHTLEITYNEQKLVLSIINESTGVQIKPSQSSEGMKWVLALFFKIQILLNSSSSSHILLLDNPAIAIHDEGKNDVRKFLTRAAEKKYVQIVYTTHEKALIDSWRLDRIRFVKKDQSLGTITYIPNTTGIDSMRLEISKHVGSPAKYSLFGAPITIFVEGISDLLFLTRLNEYAMNVSKTFLHSDVYSFCDIGGVNKTEQYLKICDSLKVDYCFIVDSGEEAKRLADKLGGKKFNEHYVNLADILNKPKADIEDLIGSELYNELFKLTYKVAPDLDYISKSHGKTVKKYEKWLKDNKKTSINKLKIANNFPKLLQSTDPNINMLLQDTLAHYSKLVKCIKSKRSYE